jgi:hypothetical protein
MEAKVWHITNKPLILRKWTPWYAIPETLFIFYSYMD